MRLKQMEEENSEDIYECLCKELDGILAKQQLTQFRKEGCVRKTPSEAIKSESESKDDMRWSLDDMLPLPKGTGLSNLADKLLGY